MWGNVCRERTHFIAVEAGVSGDEELGLTGKVVSRTGEVAVFVDRVQICLQICFLELPVAEEIEGGIWVACLKGASDVGPISFETVHMPLMTVSLPCTTMNCLWRLKILQCCILHAPPLCVVKDGWKIIWELWMMMTKSVWNGIQAQSVSSLAVAKLWYQELIVSSQLIWWEANYNFHWCCCEWYSTVVVKVIGEGCKGYNWPWKWHGYHIRSDCGLRPNIC